MFLIVDLAYVRININHERRSSVTKKPQKRLGIITGRRYGSNAADDGGYEIESTDAA